MDFIPVRRKKGRRAFGQQYASTDALNLSKTFGKNCENIQTARSQSCNTINIIGKEERKRAIGARTRRCICKWVLSFGRLLRPDQHKTDYDTAGCAVCRINFSAENIRESHFDDHGKEFTIWLTHSDHRIARNTLRLSMKYLPRSFKLIMRVENDSKVVLILSSVYLLREDNRLEPTFDGVLRMIPGYSYEFEHIFRKCTPNYVYTVVMMATVVGTQVEIVEQYHVRMLKNSTIVGTSLALGRLPDHRIPEYLQALYGRDFEHNIHYHRLEMQCLDNLRKYNAQGLQPASYVEHLRLLNMIEDYDLQQIFATYTIINATLTSTEQNRRYLITTDQFQVAPTLLEEDGYVRVMVTKHSKLRGVYSEPINGYIDALSEDIIVITMQQPVPFQLPCRVEFPLNRTQYKLEYNALNIISKIELETLLFPKVLSDKKRPVRQREFNWFQPTISANKEQMTAIRNIINMTSFPVPYILFGPPGTGKTSTIVEAVLQIWKFQPKAHVLVAAASNFACDELTKRLQRFVPEQDIFRFFSRSCERKIDNIDIDILEISNLSTGEYEIPSYEHVYQSRIIVSTVTNCGRFAQARIKSNFFDYIFIDECGSAKEISAMVPIAGIGTDGSQVTASIILAGDPKQLGPVVRNDYLQRTVQNTSLLERLMALPIYKRNPSTGWYNHQVITKLLDNYRSHSALIHYSNQWFYEGELRARASPALTDWALNWNCLPNTEFPMIFHSVVGTTRMDKRSCSSYNKEEAQKVLFYIQNMLQDGINDHQVREEDIGIVTPYAKQVSYLKQGCRNYGWDNIEVGSAEQYQGREKPIIVVSTVRAQKPHVGFLCNIRRLNVVITRARALMIIVGDPGTLQRNPHWYRLLRYISENGGVRGNDFVLEKPEMDPSDNAFLVDDFA